MPCVTLDPIADARWMDFAARAPEACAFHHPAWLRLLRDQYGYRLTACAVAAGGRLLAGLPVAEVHSRITGRRLVALPFSDLCPPLIACDVPEAGHAAALGAGLLALAERHDAALEIRGGATAFAGAAVTERFHHHVLALELDVAAVIRRFRRPQVTRGVRRALRQGLVVESRTDRAALEAYYELHVATRARLGAPTQPRAFILRFADLFAAGLGFVMLVRLAGKPAAGAVFLVHGDVMSYKYGASDARFLSARPNNLLFMRAIEWGCANGMRVLDFGRTDIGQEGLRSFKLAWGAEERELRYVRLGGSGRPRRGAWLHPALATTLRHSPPIASRVVGEVLYRHAG